MTDTLDNIFGENGLLSQHMPYFTPRQSQYEMSKTIWETINRQDTLVAEAGTGTGKTYAYLVPALLSGQRTLISTATKTLQDQLFNRDLPAILQALSLPIVTALLKGRDNYLCLYRLRQTKDRPFILSDSKQIALISNWAKETFTGDKAELSVVSDQSSIWSLVTSTKDNCLGSDCPNFADCFVMKARREAMAADVVVINHHLFLADLVLKDQQVGELLPTVSVFIFDEAHQLPDIATVFFGKTVSTAQLTHISQDIAAALFDLPVDFKKQSEYLRQWDHAVMMLKNSVPAAAFRLSKHQLPKQHALYSALDDVMNAQTALMDFLEKISDQRSEIELILNRLEEIGQTIDSWCHSDNESMIDWLESTQKHVRLHQSPLSAADCLKPHWENQEAAHIFLSATLAVGRQFSHFISEAGLNNPRTAHWESPFDYIRQTLLYIPKFALMPNDPGFTDIVVKEGLSILKHSKGGAFFLFTSLAAIQAAKKQVSQWLNDHQSERLLLVQGEMSRSELLSRFRESGNAILLGSYSFWEGVDVAGPSLSFVLIDKIPFQAPDDPLLIAKSDKLRQQGKNPFMLLQLPKAVISLKQGTGRLIRSETDAGILMIGDPRLFTKSYGAQILHSLPFKRRSRQIDEVIDFLNQQNKEE